jgi:SAM-dependent methyltransferase
MPEYDDIAKYNRRFWSKLSSENHEYARPWLDLDKGMVQRFADSKLAHLPEPYTYIYPNEVFRDIAGKDVLCLAASGGQQSAIFGLLGANVTVFDLTPEQLENDRKAAEHYGYKINTIEGDMRDLSAFAESSFDLVYQAISLVFVPDVKAVYREVYRILRHKGLYKVEHGDPATGIVEETSWDGEGYRILCPYKKGRIDDPDAMEFRHTLEDIYNGLIEVGFSIKSIHEDPRHHLPNPDAKPGTLEHMLGWVMQYFTIIGAKE